MMYLNLTDTALEIHHRNEYCSCTWRPLVIQVLLPTSRILFSQLFVARKMSSVANSVCVYVTSSRNIGFLCINRETTVANGRQKADNLQGCSI